MVRIRLQREGKPKQAYYRLVATERADARDGRPIEVLGFYNPRLEKEKLTINEDRVKHWYSKGAQASETVKNLLVSAGVWQKISAKA